MEKGSLIAWELICGSMDCLGVCHRLLLKDATFINESYGDGQHRGNFLKWKRAAVYMRSLTQAIRPGKLINPVTCLVAKAKTLRTEFLMILFSRWEIPSWIVNLAKMG